VRSGTKEILIAGLALLATGIILGILSVQIIVQGSYSLTNFDNISPGASVTDDINMTIVYKYHKPGVNMTLVVDSEPEHVPMRAEVTQPTGEKLIDMNFSDMLFTTFVPTVGGEHIVTIRNLGVENASVKIETGTSSFLATSYFNPESMISRNLGLTALLILLGLVILIYGGIIFQIRGRKTSADLVTTKPVGLRVYALVTGVAGILFILTVSYLAPILLPISGEIQGTLLVNVLIMVIMTGIGATYLIIMAGLLYFRKSWIWGLGVIMSIISIGIALISISLTGLVLEYYYQYPLTIANIIINGTLIYYVNRPQVKAYFQKATSGQQD
jgi:hypothetical protein